MALYAAVARLGFRRQFAYMQAALWGMVTNVFFGALRIAVLLALFGKQPQVAGYTAQDAVTYVALTQVFIASFSLFLASTFSLSPPFVWRIGESNCIFLGYRKPVSKM